MELRQELQDKSKIAEWSNRYCADCDTDIKNLVPKVKKRGYLKKTELETLIDWKLECRWKQRGLCFANKNDPDDVKEITCKAFRETDDIKSIRCLLRLHSVGWAIGSAILHWFHEGRYPIWDIHAKSSLQLDKGLDGSNERWKAYVKYCKDIADQYEVCMRTLDRALFEYGKNNC